MTGAARQRGLTGACHQWPRAMVLYVKCISYFKHHVYVSLICRNFYPSHNVISSSKMELCYLFISSDACSLELKGMCTAGFSRVSQWLKKEDTALSWTSPGNGYMYTNYSRKYLGMKWWLKIIKCDLLQCGKRNGTTAYVREWMTMERWSVGGFLGTFLLRSPFAHGSQGETVITDDDDDIQNVICPPGIPSRSML